MTPYPLAVKCARCGCLGNSSCGHAPLDKEKCCTLDSAEICSCCRVREKYHHDSTIPKHIIEQLRIAVDESCSCGGKGPEDGCCPACEVWHRMHGRKVKTATPARGNTLAGEIIACLRANLLYGRLTTQDDGLFEMMLRDWSEKAQMDVFEMTLGTCDRCGGTGKVTDDQITPAKTLAEEIKGEIERLKQLAIAARGPDRYIFNTIEHAQESLECGLRYEKSRIKRESEH